MSDQLYKQFSSQLTKRAIDFALGRQNVEGVNVLEGKKETVHTTSN